MALLRLYFLNVEIYRVHDYVVGHILFIPLFILSALQIPNMIQTWLLYHNALSSDLRVEELLSLQSSDREEKQKRTTASEISSTAGSMKTEVHATTNQSSEVNIMNALAPSINVTKVVKHFSTGDVMVEESTNSQDLGHFLPIDSKEIKIQEMTNLNQVNGSSENRYGRTLGMNKKQFQTASQSDFSGNQSNQYTTVFPSSSSSYNHSSIPKEILREDSQLENSNLSGSNSSINPLQVDNHRDFKFVSPSNPPPK